jgi:3-oxoadipate enol-lactonase
MRVLAPDLRGHGDSSATSGVYSMDLLAGDLKALLEALNITRKVVICGLSMGGYVALAFCRNYPQQVAGLILAGSRSSADTPETRAGREQSLAQVQTEGKEPIIAAMLPKMLAPATYDQRPELVNQVRTIMESTSVAGIAGDLAGMKDRPDATPTLATLKVPLLIIQGMEDQFATPEVTATMRAAAPRGKIVKIADAGHLPNLEQPVSFNQTVLNFIMSIPSS